MNLTDSELETLKHEATSIGMTWHTDYSGRGMYGRTTWALSGTQEEIVNLQMNLLSMVKYAALDSEVDEAEGYENILIWLMADSKCDSYGKDKMILY